MKAKVPPPVQGRDGCGGADACQPVFFHQQVKCKDCGAFGHTARSRRCPVKRGVGALTLQALGPKREKENQAPSKPENLQNTRGSHQPHTQKGQAHR